MTWDTSATAAWTVAELNSYIRDLFEVDDRLQDVQVTGELSNFTAARSGHWYFTLKDETAQLKCVMWRSATERVRFRPQAGDAVVLTGRVSVYETGGVYQLYAERMRPVGQGELALAFEQLKARLAAEGLFEASHKQPLLGFPRRIGIVTSLDAAALRDILHVLNRRYPLVSVLIAPTLVQGADAPAQIVRALTWLDGRDDIDTLIVARGGGSIEDLWAFNDEAVARAIFQTRHPVITGVGHETDFTIADFVADVRAPTPSAAAELSVPDVSELFHALDNVRATLHQSIGQQLAQKQRDLAQLRRTLNYVGPQTRLANGRQRLDALASRLDRALGRRREQWHNQLALWQTKLAAVSPPRTLARGYAIVRDAEGQIVRSVTTVTAEQLLSIQFADGDIQVKVIPPHD